MTELETKYYKLIRTLSRQILSMFKDNPNVDKVEYLPLTKSYQLYILINSLKETISKWQEYKLNNIDEQKIQEHLDNNRIYESLRSTGSVHYIVLAKDSEKPLTAEEVEKLNSIIKIFETFENKKTPKVSGYGAVILKRLLLVMNKIDKVQTAGKEEALLNITDYIFKQIEASDSSFSKYEESKPIIGKIENEIRRIFPGRYYEMVTCPQDNSMHERQPISIQEKKESSPDTSYNGEINIMRDKANSMAELILIYYAYYKEYKALNASQSFITKYRWFRNNQDNTEYVREFYIYVTKTINNFKKGVLPYDFNEKPDENMIASALSSIKAELKTIMPFKMYLKESKKIENSSDLLWLFDEYFPFSNIKVVESDVETEAVKNAATR